MENLPESYANTSISHGTLDVYDLIEASMLFLEGVAEITDCEDEFNRIKDEFEDLETENFGYAIRFTANALEPAQYLWNEDLQELFAAIAPENTFFGGHEGDSSDIGFWEYADDVVNEYDNPYWRTEE